MNLYKFYTNPDELLHFTEAAHHIPAVVWDTHNKNPEQLKSREAVLAKDPEIACTYATKVLKGRFPAGEPAIATNPKTAYTYATKVLKGRFPEGEPAIAKDADEYWYGLPRAYFYAKEILNGSWSGAAKDKNVASDVARHAEAVIAKYAEAAYTYASEILKGRFPQGEPTIIKAAETKGHLLIQYAKNVLKGRFPEGEPAIIKNGFAYTYAKDVLNGTWEDKVGGETAQDAETAIAKDDWTAYNYAKNIIQGPFPEGEPAIWALYKEEYEDNVLKGRPWKNPGG
jgi:hypothetical protein